MQPALDSNTLDRLIALGRQQGHLTTADLQASLPIISMTTEEIARLITQIEESGVAVELEDRLTVRKPPRAPIPEGGAQIIPFPQRAARPRNGSPKPGSFKPIILQAEPALATPSASEPRISTLVHWVVAGAGLFAFSVFGLILFTAGA